MVGVAGFEPAASWTRNLRGMWYPVVFRVIMWHLAPCSPQKPNKTQCTPVNRKTVCRKYGRQVVDGGRQAPSVTARHTQPLRPHRRGGCCVHGVTAAAAAAAPGCEREPPPGALHRQRRRSQQPTGCGATPNRQPTDNHQRPDRATQLPGGDARAQRLAW